MDDIIDIFKNIVSGLEVVHKTGYVMNDMKMDNIMLHKSKDELRTILIDFGLATPYRDKEGKHFAPTKTD